MHEEKLEKDRHGCTDKCRRTRTVVQFAFKHDRKNQKSSPQIAQIVLLRILVAK